MRRLSSSVSRGFPETASPTRRVREDWGVWERRDGLSMPDVSAPEAPLERMDRAERADRGVVTLCVLKRAFRGDFPGGDRFAELARLAVNMAAYESSRARVVDLEREEPSVVGPCDRSVRADRSSNIDSFFLES